ncbi:MAG TPA: winged helix-turn-helix domain-containing protein [Methylomirabilota bacterium]|nr:winged helix-turn-helix domain-containing protein [Methylomirabilota bacterium]
MAEKTELSTTRVLRFGVFQVNLAARELRKHGVRMRLPAQPFRVLSILLDRPGQIVSRDEMCDKLWDSDTFVDYERSLNSAVRKLRAVLGDSQESPRYIETVPRLGYRFIAPIEEISSAQTPVTAALEPAPTRAAVAVGHRGRHWFLFLGIPAVLLPLVAGYFMFSRARVRPQPLGERLMLAVLPFENLTGDAAQDYLSDGLTEEMIAQLGHLDPEHLGVIARTSVMHYKHTTEQVAQIGHELGVQYVLEGSLRREADRVRITAQLVQMKDQTHIWSRQYDRELKSLLALQGEIAQETADEIQLTLGHSHKPWAADRKLASPSSYQAYDLYLKGRYFWNKRTKEGFQQAAEYFQQSIVTDPNYARAYAGLADTFALMSSWSFMPQTEAMPKARAAALRGLQLDDSLAEAHTSLALIAENYDYDWQTAEKEYRRAIQLDPQYATAHQWYAECLSFEGRFPEALEESEQARQLDPLSLIIATDHAVILYFARQYDRAIEQFRTVLAMEPNFGRAHMVVYPYVEKGMFPEALAETAKWRRSDGSPEWQLQAYVYGRWGKPQQAERALAQWKPGSGAGLAHAMFLALQAYIATGRKDEALALIEKSYREHSNLVTTLKVEPALDPLRGDPRFQELLRRVGLAER